MRRKKLIFIIIILIILGCFSLVWGADRGPISSGETKGGFQLAGPSYMDTWTFNGNTDDRVLIDAEPTSGSTCLDINLYPPGGGPREASGRQWLDRQLQQTGNYTIVIGECYFDDVATYDISLTKIPSQLRPGLYNPHPANGAIISDLSGILSWDPVPGATGYDVYFGENVIVPIPRIRNNITSPSTPFPALDPYKVYYWQVVARTSSGNIEGPYWWFETTDSPGEPLLYWSRAPCRIVDTRKGGGIIGASSQRNFRVYGSGSVLAPQRGDSGGCSSPFGEPLAAHLNMVAVNPTGKGNLQAFPVEDAGAGAGLSVNYNTIDTNLANDGTVKTVTGSGPDITVASKFSSTHTAIDVLGYYFSTPSE